MSISLSFRTEEQVRDQLDRIAESLDRNRNWVINEAIGNYVEQYAWQLAEIAKGEADLKAERIISTEQLRSRLRSRAKKKAS